MTDILKCQTLPNCYVIVENTGMEPALRTRSEGNRRTGAATLVAQPAQAIRHSVFSPLLYVDNAVCGSAGLASNAADGIARKSSCVKSVNTFQG